MNATDALTQHLASLDKPTLLGIAGQAATLARENTDLKTEKTQLGTQIVEMDSWFKRTVAQKVGHGSCLMIATATGTAVGAAYGVLPPKMALASAVAVAAASAATAMWAHKSNPDVCNAAMAATAGACAGASALEAAKGASEIMARRAAAKSTATAAAPAPATPPATGSKKAA